MPAKYKYIYIGSIRKFKQKVTGSTSLYKLWPLKGGCSHSFRLRTFVFPSLNGGVLDLNIYKNLLKFQRISDFGD